MLILTRKPRGIMMAPEGHRWEILEEEAIKGRQRPDSESHTHDDSIEIKREVAPKCREPLNRNKLWTGSLGTTYV